MLEHKIIKAIEQYIPGAQINLIKLECNRPGYSIEVHSELFKDCSLLEQHRKVKAALADFIHADDLHAITIKTTF